MKPVVSYGMDLSWHPELEVLPASQQQLWPELLDVPSGFILYGGTALALQLGHRESIDFDFFSNRKFDPDQLLSSIPFLGGARIVQKSPNTLIAIVDREGAVQVSFFGVPKLGRIQPPLIAPETNLRIATLLDLAGTKAAVVQKRAEAKDYIDIDAILQHGKIDLSQALSAARLIYGSQFNPELTLKALSFFGDGNLESVPLQVQNRLADAIRTVELDNLPDLLSAEHNSLQENGQ